MLPFLPGDLTANPLCWNCSWPVDLDELTCYQHEIEDLFELGHGPYDFPGLIGEPEYESSQFIPRLAKWPPFRLRNVATLLKKDIESKKGPELWLNATATGFTFDHAGRLSSVKMHSMSGNTLSVSADETIITAGAIESTRLLLLADYQHGNRIFAPDNMLGRYFFDHLSISTATLFKVRRAELNRIIGFRFENNLMRNLRFEPCKNLRIEKKLPAGFVHIGFSTAKPSGFDALRAILRSLQKGSLPKSAEGMALIKSLPWLTRALWWRFVEKRLLFPDSAEFDVHVVIEQEPQTRNRITLSASRTDAYGCPLARIDWRVCDQDAARMISITQAFMNSWNESSLSRLAQIELNLPEDPKHAIMYGGGIYHPGGSTRMGLSARQGVVDRDLRTFRVPNLSVVSTSVFPSGGGANPTMMLMMAALRAADRIAR